jgi:hypothetical protein
MANERQHRQQLKSAIIAATNSSDLNMDSQTIDFFVNRAVTHVYARWATEVNRDRDIAAAAAAAKQLVVNLQPIVEARSQKSVQLNEAQGYVQRAVGCFYPFCKPNP